MRKEVGTNLSVKLGKKMPSNFFTASVTVEATSCRGSSLIAHLTSHRPFTIPRIFIVFTRLETACHNAPRYQPRRSPHNSFKTTAGLMIVLSRYCQSCVRHQSPLRGVEMEKGQYTEQGASAAPCLIRLPSLASHVLDLRPLPSSRA
jgi:hypothetical protein